MNLGPTELIIILVIVLLLFGSSKLPKLARSLGQAQREFKQGTTDGLANDSSETKTPAKADSEAKPESDTEAKPESKTESKPDSQSTT